MQSSLVALSRRRSLFSSLVLSGLSITLLLVMLLAVSFGSTVIPFATIVQIILNGSGLFHFPHSWDASLDLIILQLRLPLVIGAALVGAALAVAGTLFQGMLRNPLADPFLIGSSSGAALGATIAFVLPFASLYGTFFSLTPILAFWGALLTVLFVYALARTDGQTPVVMLLLAGVVVNSILVAVQTLLLTLQPPAQATGFLSLFNWLSGGIAVAGWSSLVLVAGLIIVGIISAFLLADRLDVFSLGEESAAHLGLRVERIKFWLIIVASLLTAAAVSISGLIGFVGLVTPHVMRLILGPQHRLLIPASALSGAIFLTCADLLARVVLAPQVLPVGIFTAFVGAHFFLFLLRNHKREYKW